MKRDETTAGTPGTDDIGAMPKGQRHSETARLIRERIMSGELRPGERLREVWLCENLGVSRTPVREAFRTLAAEGLIELKPNRSVVVAPLDASHLADLFVVFANVEALAGELACHRISNAEIEEIGDLLSEMINRHASGERLAYLRLNQDIHRKTVEAAGNPVLLTVWQSLVPQVERARSMPNLNPDRWTEALLEHSKMFTALSARNGALLATLTREHFMNAIPHLEELAGSGG